MDNESKGAALATFYMEAFNAGLEAAAKAVEGITQNTMTILSGDVLIPREDAADAIRAVKGN